MFEKYLQRHFSFIILFTELSVKAQSYVKNYFRGKYEQKLEHFIDNFESNERIINVFKNQQSTLKNGI